MESHQTITPKKKAGRRKIKIEFIEDKSRRQITFSKRKAGLMKKAYELTTLTGTQALLLVASETGHVYTFATPKLQPFVTLPEGKQLIQTCLNAPDQINPSTSSNSGAAAGGSGASNASMQMSTHEAMYDDEKIKSEYPMNSQQWGGGGGGGGGGSGGGGGGGSGGGGATSQMPISDFST